MIIIGDKQIKYETFHRIEVTYDIQNTPANCIVLFDFDFDLLEYVKNNNIKSAVIVDSIRDVVYASTFGVTYIIISQRLMMKAQKLANSYMYDSKILGIIDEECDIEKIAYYEIDGAIYRNLLLDSMLLGQ